MLVLALALLPQDTSNAALRAGLDTLYGGQFERAAVYFELLAAERPADPAPLVFQAGSYIWWASARDSTHFEAERIDSLLGAAMERATRAAPGAAREFWLATSLGYRARQREETGHSFGAAKDAKAMRDIYRRVLAADSTCVDCYLGLGVYDYGLARAGALARLFAKLIGLGSGDAERGIRYLRRASHDGDLARVEATWVLAAALMREAERDEAGRPVLEREARGYVEQLAARYPGNPVFQRFLNETSVVERAFARPSAAEAVRPATAAPAAAVALAPIGRRQRGELAEHVVHVTLDGVGRDVQPLRDFFIAETGGDQILDLLLALREPDVAGSDRRRGLRARLTDGGRRRQIGPARDGANRLDDVLGGRVLHDESVGPAVDELMDVLLRGNEIHHDRFRAGSVRLERRQELIAVAVGERGIEQHDVRLGVAQLLRAGAGAFDGRNDVDVRIRGEQFGEPIAHQAIVFDHEHANARSVGWHGLRGDASIAPPPIQNAFALRQSVFHSASPLWRHSTLNAANCPRHVHPHPEGNIRLPLGMLQRSSE
jgi:hypothetical protein